MDKIQVTKVSDSTIQVTTTPVPIIETKSLDVLIRQRDAAQGAVDRAQAVFDALDAQVTQAQSLGIKTNAQLQASRISKNSVVSTPVNTVQTQSNVV